MSIYLSYDVAKVEMETRLRHAERRRRAQLVRTRHDRGSARRRWT